MGHRRAGLIGVALAAAVTLPLVVRAVAPSGQIGGAAVAAVGAVRLPRVELIADGSVERVVAVAVGSSFGGRPIVAFHRRGSAEATRTVLAIGAIHGDESDGMRVVELLATMALPADLDLWWVPALNPDGVASGLHGNGNGVDLNRNWPANWRPPGTIVTSGRMNSGVAPASEPETQAMMAFVSQIDPDVTVWYHDPWNTVDCNPLRVGRWCTAYAALTGMTTSFDNRPGTATDWIMTSGHGVSFVVEFGSVAPSAATVRLHAEALLALRP